MNDIYFPEYKLAVEIDEYNHEDRDTVCEIKRQKALEKELGCKFVRINPDKESFNVFKAINETSMLTYCLKCKKITENIDAKILKTKNGRFMLSSECAVCGSKKSKFMKEQEAKQLLSSLGIRTPLSQVPLLNVLF